MLLAYSPARHSQGDTALYLCLLADKPDLNSPPVLVSELQPYSSAVIRIGGEEAVTVNNDPSDNGMVISVVIPASLYLTPNLPTQPGFKVKRIKITGEGLGLKVLYDREKG